MRCHEYLICYESLMLITRLPKRLYGSKKGLSKIAIASTSLIFSGLQVSCTHHSWQPVRVTLYVKSWTKSNREQEEGASYLLSEHDRLRVHQILSESLSLISLQHYFMAPLFLYLSHTSLLCSSHPILSLSLFSFSLSALLLCPMLEANAAWLGGCCVGTGSR